MSVVALQLGQCGNQLGSTFFDALNCEAERARESLSSAIRRVYFDQSRGQDAAFRARAVLIDTEPRVVQRCLEGADGIGGTGSPWTYRKESTIWRQGGAGNSWAYGFNHYGPLVEEAILERVQRETEACDRLDGFLTFQSVAGGTGSGLGSFAWKLVRESLPKAPIVAVCIWPFADGEVSVQCYNAVLSLAAAYEFTDMVILCENERYMDICRNTLLVPHPSMDTLNRSICTSILPALTPCQGAQGPLGAPAMPLFQLTGQLCAHPLYRLVTARSLPQVARGSEAYNSDSWVALQRRLVQLCSAGTTIDGPAAATNFIGGNGVHSGCCKSVASAAFLWGSGSLEAPLDGLRKLPVWRLALDPLQVLADTHELRGVERCLGLLSNCQTVLPVLTASGNRASDMLRAGAYLHLYERHGVGREELSDALLTVSQVRQSYASIS